MLPLLVLALLVAGPLSGASAGPCDTGNEIACENSKPGNSPDEWDVDGSGDPTIQGFATDISADQGGTVRFKIKTDAASYRVDIYRLGYYGGAGARKVATLAPVGAQSQPACLTDSTGLVDCGNWAVSATWIVPVDAVSGVYLARPTRLDTGGASHIPFVVRDDDGGSDLLFQTSDTTWQAYNRYGGASLYWGAHEALGNPAGRAYKVSYNRPFTTRDNQSDSYVFYGEYPTIRWLERNGYDVSYFTDVDTARRGGELLEHKAFMSVGHDEYWSAEQRNNVEAARAAGVSLAFMTANEIFWKTRWEPSIDGSATDYRTLVCYKESAANAKIDPSPLWTGRWRDGRFSPPADGGRPEHSLTGTLFQVQHVEDHMYVPTDEGRMRFWHNTSIASLPAGATATVPNALGYEWNETPEDQLRPAGLLYLSASTYTLYRYDSGAPAEMTHHMTLYRHASGALVFSTATVNYLLALDDVHDSSAGPPVDSRIQQATANLLADMGALPVTLQADLVPPTPSTDATAPTTTITSPAGGTSFDRGSSVTVTGTSTDSGGGVVAAVEVSLDGGATWHPATGRSSWSYTGTINGFGEVAIKVRATDDSGNIEAPPASRVVSVGLCPCNLWGSATTPATPAVADGAPYTLGVKFKSDIDGYIDGIRFYKGSGNGGTHVGQLWTKSGTLLAEATFTSETGSGWQEVRFAQPVGINANTTYVASYYAPSGHFAADQSYFAQATDSTPLHAPANLASGSGANGVYLPGRGFPTSTFSASNYWVDVVFLPDAEDTTRPTVLYTDPQRNAWRAPLDGDVVAAFNEAIAVTSVTPSAFELRGPGGALVPATVAHDAGESVVRLHPTQALVAGATYTATIKAGAGGIADLAGNTLAADYSWQFKTAIPGACPCTLWADSATPQTAAIADGSAYELGLKFRSDTAGYITGIRFYKGAGNSGPHMGHLWTASGQLIATGRFVSETPTGWQEVRFGAPVPIAAATTYVASYTAPSGHFALTRPGFSTAVQTGPLRGLGDGESGANGVYIAGSGFPTSGFSASNYWVDVIFDTDGTDNVAPDVSSTTPRDGATGVAIAKSMTAEFSEPVDVASVSSTTFELRDSTGTIVPATVTYNGPTQTASLKPNVPLTLSSTYTARIKGGSGGVRDPAGNPLSADVTITFTTAAPRTCPCTIFNPSDRPAVETAGDTRSHELGVRFRSDLGGWISGLRFYKGPANTGTHIGRLWTASGTQLASVTFTGESASGWQEASFATPVRVEAHTTYIASYFAPNGSFSVTHSFFGNDFDSGTMHAPGSETGAPNGVYKIAAGGGFPTSTYSASNYWVDVVFDTTSSDHSAPVVTNVTPADGSTGASPQVVATAQFNEPVDASTVNGSTFLLVDGANATVPATVTYDAGTLTATLRPNADLAAGAAYGVTVRGGAFGVKDPAANALEFDRTWSFTTANVGACPCSLWDDSARPATEAIADSRGHELGVKFQATVAGTVTGVRFYKASTNTGTHVGHLWTTTGTLLGTVTFVGESFSGWQQANFSTPIPISAGTTYVVSYFAPNGRFSLTRPYFGLGPVSKPPLIAPADSFGQPNGVYRGGTGFPNASYGGSNYWVDVVFMPG